MKILAMKPGRDSAVALVDAARARLEWSYEAEKDSYPRFEAFNPEQFLRAAGRLDAIPEVFAVSGARRQAAAFVSERARLFGAPVRYFCNSHARSHIWCSYGLSPFEQGRPCYVLVWEGGLGDFYLVDARLRVEHLGTVLPNPGQRYSLLYGLADPSFTLPAGMVRNTDAGKLMALCAYGADGPLSADERAVCDALLAAEPPGKAQLAWSPYHDIGLEHPAFTRLARRFSSALFARFEAFARANLRAGHPLLIAGGCGLNCDWNTMWRDSGLFADVFIPPCANDTGSAIGSAVDAMREYTGRAKLAWSVYSDQPFIDDRPDLPGVRVLPLDPARVAAFLHQGKIVAWTQGNCELGPRALGNRSILAAPFSAATRARLNAIKRREQFRPIAPICLEEDVGRHFDWDGPSPHMLFFQRVRDARLQAVTHVDGSARVQTVTARQNGPVHALLAAFRALSGVGVLCNTSLNFNGAGFINRTSDLYRYCNDTGIDGFVYDDKFCIMPTAPGD